ncbi:hypothetical protein M422DRAFT_223600 [Sphaerobolus stellatus SS14]|nr:hypothetical protein M422DRAFT_223600 [Sphaerobolus stellatus SS14]
MATNDSVQTQDTQSQTPDRPDPSSLPQETLAFASRIFHAVRTGNQDSNELLEASLDRGFPSNLRNEQGNSLLMLAAYMGRLETVQILLKYKADPNILNDSGQSIVAGAVYKNEKEIVTVLLDAGADPNAGKPSAIETAKTFKNEELLALINSRMGSNDASQ